MNIPLDNSVIDLTNCDREPIHLLGRVQSFGAMMVLTSDWILINASANLGEFAKVDPSTVIGELVNAMVHPEAMRRLREALNNMGSGDHSERLFGIRLFTRNETLYDCAMHFSGDHLIIEVEPCGKHLPALNLQTLRKALREICSTSELESFFKTATQHIGQLLGFDRVMLYQFHVDDSGEVIAETRNSNVDSFLGMRYPASDIPKQARALYMRNLTRIIADVGDEGVEFVHNENIDLSLSTLRTVSPLHIEYLKNMGITSSMSVSIVVEGKLWGLFACHHYEPRFVSLEQRSIAEVFAEAFSMELTSRLTRMQQVDMNVTKSLHLKMMATLNAEDSVFENLKVHLPSIQKLIPSCSLVLKVDTDVASTGDPLSTEDLSLLANRLNRIGTDDLIFTDNLAHFSQFASLGDRFAGMLAIPVSRRPRDYLIFLRREEPYEVSWAGNPEKPVELGPNGSRLTPRKSFETWLELRRGYSSPWTISERNIATQIKNTLLEVMVRNIDERDRMTRSTREQQDILIHELNHRVRNILGLIGSVVSQTAGTVNDVEEFRLVLGGRIHALADAQNQLTESNWSYSPLRRLIDVTMSPYASTQAKVEIIGDDITLSPKAFTTASLVLHELATNAMKYGVLGREAGKLIIEWSVAPDQSLHLNWIEKGVVIESMPERRGFGSVIIQRSIPYDLGGEANVVFQRDGMVATFVIPSQHIGGISNNKSSHIVGQRDPGKEQKQITLPPIDQHVLVLEDNMIIGLDLEQAVKDLGFGNIHTAASVKEALDILDKFDIDFAILDINLGSETSFVVAKRMKREGLPFLFLTGYSELKQDAMVDFKDVPVVSKPLQKVSLQKHLDSLFKA